MLLFLTPGIPEYLSGSSPLSALLTNPPQLFFQLALNLGLYGPGVLLVREAKVRWQKGWATVVILGAVYGILEEGVALSTLFNPGSPVVQNLGIYGHWLGVSWIWTEGILLVHSLFSVSIPILLVGLLVPSTNGVSFLKGWKLGADVAILGVDVAVLMALVYFGQNFWMGDGILFGSLAAMLVLVYLARRVPADWPRFRDGPPSFGLTVTFALGLSVYLGTLLIQGALGKSPAIVTFLVVGAYEGLMAWAVARFLHFNGNERYLLAFTLGAVLLLLPFGLATEFPYDIVLLADIAFLLLYRVLFRDYPAGRPSGRLSVPMTPQNRP